MELQHLKTFVAVAEAGNLTRAARALHLTQPAVSAHIKALETVLNLPVFRRTGRGMQLTEAGEALLIDARDILARTDALTRRAAELNGQGVRLVRLGVIDCGYDLQLARILGQTRARDPQLRVELVTANSAENVRNLLDGKQDLAFVEGDWGDARLKKWRLGTSRVGIIAPSKWRDPLSDGQWSRLSEFPWVFHSKGCSYYRLLENLCREHGVRFTPEFHASAFGAVKELVAEGLALSVVDLDDVQPWIDAGEVFAWGDFEYPMPVWLMAASPNDENPTFRAFIEVAVEAHRVFRRHRAKATARPGI